MPKKQIILSSVIIVTLISLWLTYEKPSKKFTSINGSTMGTSYTIKARVENPQQALAVKNNIDQLLIDFNDKVSTYIPNSEISRFNRLLSTEWFRISKDFHTIVDKAMQISSDTKGAFDITIAPLVNAYGFGPDRVQKRPSSDSLAKIKELIGYARIELKTQNGEYFIRKKTSQVQIDLSSIAKGYGVDILAKHLDQAGFENFMVEIGGEIRTKTDGSKGWKIAIEKPVLEQGKIEKILNVNNRALATSGNYRNIRTFVGESTDNVSHILDPRTVGVVANSVLSVSVIADNCMSADAWATSLLILGQAEGLELAEKAGIEVYFLVREKEQTSYRAVYTKNFQNYIKNDTLNAKG